MTKKIVLENVPRDDKSFLEVLPRGYKHWQRLKTDHPTPFIFVEYESKEASDRAIKEINSREDIRFKAKHWEERRNNRSTDTLVDNDSRQSKQSQDKAKSPQKQMQNLATPIMPSCVLCQNGATLMCERCRDPYCSQECQRMHWNIHRTICRRMPSLVPYMDLGTMMSMAHISFSNGIHSISKPTTSTESVSEKNMNMSMKTEPTKSPHKTSPKSPMVNGIGDGGRNPTPRGFGSTMELTSPRRHVPQLKPTAEVETKRYKVEDLERLEFPKSDTIVQILYNVDFTKAFINSQDSGSIMSALLKTGIALGKDAATLREPLEPSRLYLAPYHDPTADDHWYRVLVRSYNEVAKTVSVAYIDFGNMAELEAAKLRELPDEMMRFPRVSHRVVLQDVPSEPTFEEDISYKEDLISKPLLMKYTGEAKKVDTQVTLYDIENGNKCINDYLNRKKMLDAVQKFKPLKFTMDSFPMKTFTSLEDVDCFIQSDNLLEQGLIYIMTLPDAFKLSDLMDRAEKYYESSTPYTPSVKEVCFAKYAYGNDAEMLYRVEVDEVGEEKCYVRCIDYGNYDRVPTKNIRQMTQEFVTECCLLYTSIEGIGTPWPEERIKKFKSIVYKNNGVLKAKKIEYQKGELGSCLTVSIPDIIAQL